MADYFTHYSLVLPHLSESEFAWWRRLDDLLDEADDDEANPELAAMLGYREDEFFAEDLQPAQWGFRGDVGERSIRFEDDAGYANLEVLSRSLQRFLQLFRPRAYVVVHYASTCSKPRVGGFGGGLVYVTAEAVVFRSTLEVEHALFLERRELERVQL